MVTFENCDFKGLRLPKSNQNLPPMDLLLIQRSLCTVQDCSFRNSAGLGIRVAPMNVEIDGVTLRRITGQNNRSGLIMVQGNEISNKGTKNVIVEDIAAYVGIMRQAHALRLENGVVNVFVDGLFAKGCTDGVFVAHSGTVDLPNRITLVNLEISEVSTALLVRGEAETLTEISVDSLIVRSSRRAVYMKNAEAAVLYRLKIFDSRSGYSAQMQFDNCDYLTVRAVTCYGNSSSDSVISLAKSRAVKIISVVVSPFTNFLYGITFFDNLRNPVGGLVRAGNNFNNVVVSALRIV
mmetsp:Transcript_25299/g.36420  ORF Transcript_25299/g.36420 Transcript_25299/m.36420 type:complete len:294 (-) Transcript_25299:289-1170(-)